MERIFILALMAGRLTFTVAYAISHTDGVVEKYPNNRQDCLCLGKQFLQQHNTGFENK